MVMSEVEILLRSIGKSVFLNILFPELRTNFEISADELARKHPMYADFSSNSKRTRLSKARTIFKLNRLKEALQIIESSGRVSEEDKRLARQYLNQL